MKRTCLMVACAISALLQQSFANAADMPEPVAVDVNGTTLDVVDVGEGVPIVFVHGAISDLRAWAEYVQPISAGHRFIAYTRRHYGQRAWPEDPVYDHEVHGEDLAALLETLDASPAWLVSWSNSANAVTHAAVAHPERVSGIVHYEPVVGSDLMEGGAHADLYAAAEADWLPRWGAVGAQLEAGDERHALRKMVELVFEMAPGDFESLDPVAQALHLDNARTIPLLFAAAKTTPITCDYVAAIEVPTLVMLGVRTHKAWSMEAERMAACLPSATLVALPGVNHRGPVEVPGDIARSILEFVDEQR